LWRRTRLFRLRRWTCLLSRLLHMKLLRRLINTRRCGRTSRLRRTLLRCGSAKALRTLLGRRLGLRRRLCRTGKVLRTLWLRWLRMVLRRCRLRPCKILRLLGSWPVLLRLYPRLWTRLILRRLSWLNSRPILLCRNTRRWHRLRMRIGRDRARYDDRRRPSVVLTRKLRAVLLRCVLGLYLRAHRRYARSTHRGQLCRSRTQTRSAGAVEAEAA